MFQNSKASLHSAADTLGEDARATASRAMDTTRQVAGEAMGKAGERVRDLGQGMKELASRGASSVSEAGSVAQARLRDYGQATVRYVSEEPVKAALIAAAVGAVVAGLIIASRRRDSDY